MTTPITLRELEERFLNLEIPEEALADYVEIRPDQSRPFAPAIRAEVLGDVVSRWAKERRRRQSERDLSRCPALPTIYAEGDSWFQFPVFIQKLIGHLGAQFNIHCTSTAGNTLQNMVFRHPEYLTELKRLILVRGLDVRGFFFSGAGNDVIGEGNDGIPALQAIVKPLDASETPAWHLDTPACKERLDFSESAYRRWFNSVDEVFPALAYPQLRIYLHGYDSVQVRSLPDGDPHRPFWARDWTGGPLLAKGFTDNTFGSARGAAGAAGSPQQPQRERVRRRWARGVCESARIDPTQPVGR
jgi:hypothetical protein